MEFDPCGDTIGYNHNVQAGSEQETLAVSGSISVIYEKGVLRPLRPLALLEHTRLKIQIVNSAETTTKDAERAAQVLVAAELIDPAACRGGR